MKEAYLNIADFIIKVKFDKIEWVYLEENFIKDFKRVFGGFIVSRSPKVDFTFLVTEKKVFRVIARNLSRKKTYFIDHYQVIHKKRVETYYHTGCFMFQYALRDVLHLLLSAKSGFVVHASAVLTKQGVELFLGKPTAGKSTIMKLLSSDYEPFADDNVLVRKIGKSFFCYQSPLAEKENWIKRGKGEYLIDKIFFLHKSPEVGIKEMSDMSTKIERFFLQVWTERSIVQKQGSVILNFIKSKRFYILSFEKDRTGLMSFIQNKKLFG